jgi:hypothetical protein
MYNSRLLVPKGLKRSNKMIDEMSMPRALLRSGPYDCRAADDKTNVAISGLLFNNATKQDKYKLSGSFPSHGMQTSPTVYTRAPTGPLPAGPEKQVAIHRADSEWTNLSEF